MFNPLSVHFYAFALLFVLGNRCLAQAYELTITTGDREYAAALEFDGVSTFILGSSNHFWETSNNGRPYYIKVNSDGEILWERIIESDMDALPAATETLNDTYYLAASNTGNHIYLERLKRSTGAENWSVFYDDFRAWATDLLVVEEDVYLAGVHYPSTEEGNYVGDFLLAKISGEDGSILWQTTFGNENSEGLMQVKLTNDNHLFVCGFRTFTDPQKVQIVYRKYTLAGEMIWEGVVDYPKWMHPIQAQEDQEGNFYLAGRAATNSYNDLQAFVLKLDAQGEVMWINEYGGEYATFGEALEIVNDRLVLLVTQDIVPEFEADLELWTLDFEGNLLCTMTLVDAALSERVDAEDLVVLSNNQFAALSSRSSFSTSLSDQQIHLLVGEEHPCLVNSTKDRSTTAPEVRVSIHSSTLLIEAAEDFLGDVRIIDVLGRTVLEQPIQLWKNTPVSLAFPDRNQGYYILQISDEKDRFHSQAFVYFPD